MCVCVCVCSRVLEWMLTRQSSGLCQNAKSYVVKWVQNLCEARGLSSRSECSPTFAAQAYNRSRPPRDSCCCYFRDFRAGPDCKYVKAKSPLRICASDGSTNASQCMLSTSDSTLDSTL